AGGRARAPGPSRRHPGGWSLDPDGQPGEPGCGHGLPHQPLDVFHSTVRVDSCLPVSERGVPARTPPVTGLMRAGAEGWCGLNPNRTLTREGIRRWALAPKRLSLILMGHTGWTIVPRCRCC